MKRFSLRQILLLCLPLAFIAIVAAIKIKSSRQQRFYFSQPFAPRLEVVRAKVPPQSGLFEARAGCLAIGGNGQSSWLVRAQLFDISGKTPREIWNSEKTVVPGVVGILFSDTGGFNNLPGPTDRVANSTGAGWRFRRYNDSNHLKIIVEAVAMPFPPEERGELGTQTTNIRQTTHAQIAQARQQPGAHYFRESLILDAKDDDQHWYSVAEMNR